MEILINTVDWIEKYPVTGGAALTIAIGIFGFLAIKVWGSFASGKKKPYISSVFYSLGKKYVIVAVHEYIPCDESASGYKQIQHSRRDQWQHLIEIKSTLLNLRHQVVPNDKSAHLAVVIRKNKYANEKLILFNR